MQDIRTPTTPETLAQLNLDLAGCPPEEILKWAWSTYGTSIVATSSFQTQSVPLLHLIASVAPEMPVIFLDTGFHFPETLAFRDQLVCDFGLNIRIVRPRLQHRDFCDKYGELYLRNPDLCCHINKVEPLEMALDAQSAWITGIRGDQTQNRQNTATVSLDRQGRIKISPILSWTSKDLGLYMNKHGLPQHPLFSKGYMSIGCAPCTRPVMAGENERAGRWSGKAKTECGIHLTLDSNTAGDND